MWISGNYCAECIDSVHVLLQRSARRFWRLVWSITDRRAVTKMTVYRRETQQVHWLPLRSSISAADTLLTTTTSKHANIPSHAYRIPAGMNFLELRFLASADGITATAYVYAARKDDDVVLVCSIALTAGGQVATDGRFYVDTMTITELWLKDLESADVSGGNRISRIAFDALGYQDAFVLFNPIASGTWGAEITGG